mmetsp:Transcript_96924/g.273963  ORF Transcript_96924/g.273963 Transcript_96924/m.273963 type:complete len:221 (-) Transcript_96924:89-751(-)
MLPRPTLRWMTPRRPLTTPSPSPRLRGRPRRRVARLKRLRRTRRKPWAAARRRRKSRKRRRNQRLKRPLRRASGCRRTLTAWSERCSDSPVGRFRSGSSPSFGACRWKTSTTCSLVPLAARVTYWRRAPTGRNAFGRSSRTKSRREGACQRPRRCPARNTPSSHRPWLLSPRRRAPARSLAAARRLDSQRVALPPGASQWRRGGVRGRVRRRFDARRGGL